MLNWFRRISFILNGILTLQQRFDDPTVSLPEGFLAEPNIRQGREGSEFKNGSMPKPPPFVRTQLGNYEGYFMKVISGREIYAFEGVRYAEQQMEKFVAPVPKKPFEGTFSAKSPGHDCVQTFRATVTLDSPRIFFGNQDCLTCNIYTPQIRNGDNDPKLPVIINIYGGGFAAGSARDYGPSYLLEQDIILVNCNYRMGVLGFLSTGDEVAPGNYGLKDLALALDWVHQHIQAFGGDPKKIVIFGQSAGAVLSHLLILTGVKDKVFGLVALSGNAFVPWAVMDRKFATRMTWRFAVMNFCPTNQGNLAMVNCLRRRRTYVLEALQNGLRLAEQSIFQFSPVIEPNVPGALLTKTPEQLYALNEVPKIPAIFSENSNDADVFNIIFTLLGLLPTLTKTLLVLTPQILGFREKVANEENVLQRIEEFYGGIEKFRTDKDVLFRMVQDRMFSTGLWKSVRLHSKIAPTFAQTFAYRSRAKGLGLAGRLGLEPYDFGVPHAEELFYIFNRTDVPPIARNHEDFAIVKFMQTELANFASYGVPKYTTDELQDIEITEPANPSTQTFKMLIIDKELKLIEMPFETNVTKFWDSLNINAFPSLE